jgi:hypothetical protein
VAAGDSKKRFLKAAREILRSATLDELLDFITVRRIASGSASAAFYAAFRGGREELLADLKEETAPAQVGNYTPVTVRTVSRAMQLVTDLQTGDQGRQRQAVEELQAVALSSFDGRFDTETQEASDFMRGLMATVAGYDREAASRLGRYHEALIGEYASLFGSLLTALGREPIPALGSVESLVTVISALYDGLAVRAKVGDSGRELLEAVLLPLMVALTVPVGKDPRDPVEALFD